MVDVDTVTHGLMQLLAKNPLFKSCDGPARAKLLKACVTKEFRSDEYIFAKGESADAFYIILSGRVGVGAYSLEGRHCVFADFAEGDMFGEIAAVDGGPRTADAIALTDARLLGIRRSVFAAFLREHAEVSLALLEIIGRRIRETSARLDELRRLDFGARLARRILTLASADGADGPNGVPSLALSQERLASIIGSSRQSVNKQLRSWHQAGVVRLSRGLILILDESRLRGIAGLNAT